MQLSVIPRILVVGGRSYHSTEMQSTYSKAPAIKAYGKGLKQTPEESCRIQEPKGGD